MGGVATLLMPVKPTSLASWASHTRRNPPSTEPGTDMFVPIGTPVIAPADGRVYGYGNTIAPMTGRWVGIDFDNGMRFRCMHHSRLTLSTSVLNNRGFVRAGQEIALSGASGYGYEDWSKLSTMPPAHTHVTLWESNNLPAYYGYRPNGKPWSIDFMNYVGEPASGGAVTPEPRKDYLEMAEAIVSAPNGVVVHLRPGGKTNFGSVQEYNTFRDQVGFLRGVGATDIMPLPELSKVPKVTWDTFKYLCGYIGAPVD